MKVRSTRRSRLLADTLVAFDSLFGVDRPASPSDEARYPVKTVRLRLAHGDGRRGRRSRDL